MTTLRIGVVIPALNEEEGIGLVLRALTALPRTIERIVVIDNGSSDRTAELAAMHGAVVLFEPERGYGAACQKGLQYLATTCGMSGSRDVVAFLDADFSDYPEDLELLLAPIASGEADFVIGSRVRLAESRAAVPLPSRVGNWLATRYIRAVYGIAWTDLGPFRALTFSALRTLQMCDRTWGWTVEMQLKAAQHKIPTREVAVRYRPRPHGRSKISGSIPGACRAGAKISLLLLKDVLRRKH